MAGLRYIYHQCGNRKALEVEIRFADWLQKILGNLNKEQMQKLLITGQKTFDILLNDKIIATENIAGKKDGYFINICYNIPNKLTASKDKVKVQIQPHNGHRGGPIFAIRTVKR